MAAEGGRVTQKFAQGAVRNAPAPSVPAPLDFGLAEPEQQASPPIRPPGFVPLPITSDAGADPPARETVRLPVGAMVAVGAVILLVIAGWLAVHFWTERGDISDADRARESAAFELLRLDDAQSRQKSLSALEGLAQAVPDFVRARADAALARALALDDLRAPTAWFRSEEQAIDGQVAHLTLHKATADWQARVNALQDRRRKLESKIAKVGRDAKALRSKLDADLAILPKASLVHSDANLAVIRARGMAAAVSGKAQALELAERYRTLNGNGAWSQVISAEYALWAGVPSTQSTSLDAMLALEKQDATFLRAYVLAARLAHELHRPDVAGGQLETVIALDPSHALANELSAVLARAQTPAP